MDNNNPVSQAQVNTAPATQQATPVSVQPVTPALQQPPSEDNKKKLMMILGLVVLILILGGIYWVLAGGQKGKTSAKPTPSPTTQGVEVLEEDINSTSLDDLDKEFSTVDSDLQGL